MLESHFYSLFRHPGICFNQTKDIIKGNLVRVSVVDDIHIVRELYIVDINEKASDTHGKDMLEPVL